MRPNIVLINVDQWRGDCLSIDGHPVVHTPTLDNLALRGVRFSNAYASCPVCIPARASLLTGLTPRSHGRVGYQDGVPWDYPTTLPGEFTRQGYQTQAIGKMHVFPERSRVGFDHVILHDGYLRHARDRHRDFGFIDDYLPWLRRETGDPSADYADHGIDCNSHLARPWDKEERLHPTNWVVTQGIDFLRRRDPRQPFFLCLSFHRPHPPYDPPAWAFEQYLDEEMPAPPEGDWIDRFPSPPDPYDATCHNGNIDRRTLQRARAGYYGHMTHIDHQIARFLEALSEFKLDDQTWICFVSDHGEMLGDHHLWRKSTPYEGSARIPLILKAPGGEHLPRGVVSDGLAELRDIMPTLLDCAGLDAPDSIEGRSLLPQARGQLDSVRDLLHGECVQFGQSIQWMTDSREKFIWFSGDGTEQLFDLEADPQETRNLARQPTAEIGNRIATWRERLAAQLDGREEGFVDADGALVPGRPVNAVLSHLR